MQSGMFSGLTGLPSLTPDYTSKAFGTDPADLQAHIHDLVSQYRRTGSDLSQLRDLQWQVQPYYDRLKSIQFFDTPQGQWYGRFLRCIQYNPAHQAFFKGKLVHNKIEKVF